MKKRIIILVLVTCMIMTLMTACGSKNETSENDGKKTLRIAYQYGLAYFPLLIMKEKGLIEKHYPNCNVEWTQLNSGGAICEALTSGNLEAGAVGTGPAIINTMAGAPFKIYSSLTSQPIQLMSKETGGISLADIKPEDKIALVNIGSIQHIALAMEAERQLGDAHALDTNILSMAHPDGMSALLSGSVKYHLTSPPYIAKEIIEGISMVNSMEEVWPVGTTFVAAVASNKLYENEPELYKALCDATQEAIDYINNNQAEVAELLCKNEGVEKEVLLEWLQDQTCIYSSELNNVMNIAEFMGRANFINKAPKSISELAFDNVKGN